MSANCPNISATMNSVKDAPIQLQPFPVTLSALHLPAPISALHTLSGVEIWLPRPKTCVPKAFKAVISENSNQNLILKSFYDLNVRDKVFHKTRYVLSSLADQGISRCAFTTTFGMMTGQPRLNDQTAPQFKVDGVGGVPFVHQGYFFEPAFLVCDHIFSRQEYESQFVAVLGLRFLREYFIRAQYYKKGWSIQLPPCPSPQISELRIYTDGCCLSNGLAAGDPEAKPARGGYGIHFPTLPNGWDMYGALASRDGHTNQKAELTAVIRSLQLVRVRKISCTSISIFTDSKYAVQGLNEWIPTLWRSNGYRTSKNRAVVNAELFKSLDEEVSLSVKRGVPVTLSHVPREQNMKADALSRLGAASCTPSMALNNSNEGTSKEAKVGKGGEMGKGGNKGAKAEENSDVGRQDNRPQGILGKDLFAEFKPLVQFTPDGDYWAEWDSSGGLGENVESGMEMMAV